MKNNLLWYIAILGPIFLLYFILVKFRQMRYKKIAAELNANYISQGIFRNGIIEGTRNGRRFTVENVESVGGRSSTFWTIFSISCNYRSIPLVFFSNFFKKFPGWKFAFTRGDRRERAFITYINLKNAHIPLEEKYRFQVQSLFQDPEIISNDIIKKGDIEIEQDKVTFSIHMLLKNTNMIKQAISLIEKIANRIETTPIV